MALSPRTAILLFAALALLPNSSYDGTANEIAERSTIVARASAEASDGLAPVTDAFVSEIVADFDLAAPCFVG